MAALRIGYPNRIRTDRRRSAEDLPMRRPPVPEGRTSSHARPAIPKTRKITRWLLSRPGSLDDGDQARLAAVRAGCPHLDTLAGHIRDFADMMICRQGLLALEDWLTRVEVDDQPELHSLATGVRRDQQAVTVGLALSYSPPL